MEHMDRIAIVIVHYNTDQDTTECLQSLSKVSIGDWEQQVYVIDNGSKEPYVLPEKNIPDNIELLRSESNLGFTGGTNLGIQDALAFFQPDFVLLLNSDTLMEKDFLKKLHKSAIENPSVGLYNPMVYFAKQYEFHEKSYTQAELGKIIWYAGGSIDWTHLAGFHRGVDEIDRGQFLPEHSSQQMSDFATGCCVLIRREVIETIGFMDDSYFLYWEDVDYSLRARQAGFTIALEPTSVIYHKNAGSSEGAGSRLQQYYQTRNRFAIALKYGNWKSRLNTIRLGRKYLFENDVTARAVFDAVFRRMGKQPVI
jgi:GT2 family glycosyltransferase